MDPHDIEPTILRATGGVHPLDVTFIDEEDLKEPWKRTPVTKKISGPTPKMLMSTVSYRDANLGLFDQDTRWTDGLFHQAT